MTADAMNKQAVAAFFDRLATGWDANAKHPDAVIDRILDRIGLRPGAEVLDVGCGTGILVPDYLARGASVTGVDLSPEMLRLAREKYRGTPGVHFLLADAETAALGGPYDCVVVYNAFPHFPRPEVLLVHLGKLVKPGGTLTVAHGMSMAQLARHHANVPPTVSRSLPAPETLAAMFPPGFSMTVVEANDKLYQVTGQLTIEN